MDERNKKLLLNLSRFSLNLSNRSRSQSQLSFEVKPSLDPGHGEINDAKLDYFGTKLATASSDRTVCIFGIDYSSGAHYKQAELTGYEGAVLQLSWSHPGVGNFLATGSYDGRVIIWKEAPDSPDGVMKARWQSVFDKQLHSSAVNSVSWSSPRFGATLAAGSSDGAITILSRVEAESDWKFVQVPKCHELGCQTLSWSPSDERLASGGNDYTIKIWRFDHDDRDLALEQTLKGHTDWVFNIEWSPSEETFVSAGRDGRILVWKPEEQEEKPRWNHSRSFTNLNLDLLDMASQCSGSEAVSSTKRWQCRVLQVYTSKDCFNVGWDPMGHFIYVAGKDSDEVYLWKHYGKNSWKCVSKPEEKPNIKVEVEL